MLIPSIDLMGGRVVQLVQGERLAVASADLDGWIDRFRDFPLVQLIDLDAAMGTGDNRVLVDKVCRALPCQVGGGVRSVERARDLMGAGARRVIVGSSLFDPTGVNAARAAELAAGVGADRLVAAVDGRHGRVVIHGWKTPIAVTPADAIRALDPFVGAFLYTHVDTEGLLTGFDPDLVRPLVQLTSRRLIAAGGIRSLAEVEALDRIGVDAVVGMAIYTGLMPLHRTK
jgi:phosphoribosylformimino-5-aminoimidazole carboxamide ribotide isomerase